MDQGGAQVDLQVRAAPVEALLVPEALHQHLVYTRFLVLCVSLSRHPLLGPHSAFTAAAAAAPEAAAEAVELSTRFQFLNREQAVVAAAVAPPEVI